MVWNLNILWNLLFIPQLVFVCVGGGGGGVVSELVLNNYFVYM